MAHNIFISQIGNALYKGELIEYSLEDFGSGTFYCVSYDEFVRIRGIFCPTGNPASLIDDIVYYIALDVMNYCNDDLCDIIDHVSIAYEQ
jgi:hypothetical protein